MKKEISMVVRKVISKEVAKRYQKARKREKSKILDEFVELTGYNRKYGSWLLRNWGREVVVWTGSKRIVFIGDIKKQKKRQGKRFYDKEVEEVLKKIWYILDFICGRRLADYMEEILPKLEKCGEIEINPEVRKKLLKISGRTIDRILKEEKKKWRIKGKKWTKPGSLLKSQIPVRTFTDWNEKIPGFIEVDLVDHSGGVERGIFAQTLDATDILTGWTETMCVENKSQVRVFEGLQKIMKQFPFKILGIDSDNGSEFINHHLVKFCERNIITFTKSRPYKKNDSCYVEQKNWSVVRKAVGYFRYETEKEVETINQIYKYLRLYTNYFQPQMKLIEKKRIGSKVIKKYDKATTPYQRITERSDINTEIKKELKKQYESLNPVELKKQIVKLQNRLFEIVRNNPFYRERIKEKQEKIGKCVGIDF
jgi:hypothetical protein